MKAKNEFRDNLAAAATSSHGVMARLASVPVALETIRVFLPVVFPPVVKEQCLFLVFITHSVCGNNSKSTAVVAAS